MNWSSGKRLNYWMHDFLFNHSSVRKNLKDIRTRLCDNSLYYKNIMAQDTQELQTILSYAVQNTEYYSALGENAKLSDFPVMNKSSLNAHYDQIQVVNYKTKKTHKMHTSGSTGIPFTVIQNLEKRDRHIADLKFFGEQCGYKDHDPMCYLRAKPTATLKEQEEQNIWQLDICNLTEDNLAKYYKVMVDKKCTALIAYPSTLETAVSFWMKYFQNESFVRTIISTSETLTDETRHKLQQFFGPKCKIVARYSNTENGILGQEYTEKNSYKLNWASYYFEILKLDSDESAPAGEVGRIIVTDLFNKAFPMIRYDTGDVAKMIHPKEGFPYLSELLGRRMDLIYDTCHGIVSPFLLCRTMRLSNGIEQWQFIQNSPTEYVLKIAVTNGKEPSCDKEICSFKQTLGADAQIKVEYVNEIPVMNSLKRKLIVSNLKLNKT